MSSTTAAQTLSELLGAVADGDHSAFDQLYRRSWNHVFTMVRRTLVDESQSEEVAQDVFLEVWLTAARFDAARGGAITWLATIATRRAIDRVRSVQATRNREYADWARRQATVSDEVPEAAHLSFERDRLLKAMESLSVLQREALTVTYLHDRTMVQAAAIVGASESALKGRIHEAVLKLRGSLPPADWAA